MKKKLAVILFIATLLICNSLKPAISAEPLASLQELQTIINKGIDQYHQQEYYEAIDSFQQAFVLQENNADLLYKVAKCFEKLNKPQNALYYYLKAVDVDNQYIPALYNIGVLNEIHNNSGKAVYYYDKALKADKKLFYAYYNLANIYYKEHKYQAAISNYLKAIKFNDKFSDAYYNLATLYKEIDQKGEAKKFFKKYSDLNPSDSEVKGIIESLN